MSTITRAATRLRTPIATSSLELGFDGAATRAMTAHVAAVSAYKPSADARNAAQGGASAWSPPV